MLGERQMKNTACGKARSNTAMVFTAQARGRDASGIGQGSSSLLRAEPISLKLGLGQGRNITPSQGEDSSVPPCLTLLAGLERWAFAPRSVQVGVAGKTHPHK